ncbi:MAG: DNA-processing protein DprA [Bacteroidaceae bacterium]|nr:DNA-processing protein DprA [Bacteroidaceae bacterium]
MTEQELIYTMALSRLPSLNLTHQHILLKALGSATAIFEHRRDICDVLPDAHPRMAEALALMDTHIPRAEEELAFAQSGHVQCIHYNDEAYPARLRECPDAPLIIYYRGTTDFNARHIVSMVGTRKITEYGKDICRQFIKDLKSLCPDTVIVSGLAYGVDINCHRAALQNGMPTLAVLAHGLDQIYPRHHRDTAVKMVTQGGLLTEFMSRTNPDKKNFVQRNRIVAGISDATVVVESAAKGGSLITADLAETYHRDVFAFPGRCSDVYSEGCNNLIRQNHAALITSAEAFVETMGWETAQARQEQLAKGVQQELFPDLSEQEQIIVRALQNVDDMPINILSVNTNIPFAPLSSLLFTLEMKGVVKMLNGSRYRLL